jgi:hypothetical protein
VLHTRELIYTNRFGQEIWRELRGLDAGYDVPQLSIGRREREAIVNGYARLAGFAPDQVNHVARPAWESRRA